MAKMTHRVRVANTSHVCRELDLVQVGVVLVNYTDAGKKRELLGQCQTCDLLWYLCDITDEWRPLPLFISEEHVTLAKPEDFLRVGRPVPESVWRRVGTPPPPPVVEDATVPADHPDNAWSWTPPPDPTKG